VIVSNYNSKNHILYCTCKIIHIRLAGWLVSWLVGRLGEGRLG